MKTRHGFVSNSSGTSFVIRGVKLSPEEAIKIFKLDNEDDDAIHTAMSKFWRGDEPLSGSTVGYECIEGIVIGKSLGSGLEEGECETIPVPSVDEDKEIIEQLKKHGIEIEDLNTYAYWVGCH